MNWILLVCLLQLFSFSAFCQHFEKIISRHYDITGMEIVQRDSFYYVLVVKNNAGEPVSSQEGTILYKMDLNGNLLDSLIFSTHNATMRGFCLSSLPEGLFIGGHSRNLLTDDWRSWFSLVNTDLDTIYLEFIPTGQTIRGYSHYPPGKMLAECNQKLAVIELSNGNFNIINAVNIYNGYNFVALPKLSGGVHSFTPAGTDLMMRSISPDLQYLNDSVNHYTPGFRNELSFIIINDSTYYISSSTSTSSKYIFALTKIDHNMNIIDQFPLSFTYLETSQEAWTNAIDYQIGSPDFYYGGMFDFEMLDLTGFITHPWRFQLLKVGLDGTTKWQKVFRYNDNKDVLYTMYSLKGTSDGGCIMVGSRWDYTDPNIKKRDVYILKVDSTGYYSPVSVEESKEALAFSVHPNPASNNISIFLPDNLPSAVVRFFDVHGREVLVSALMNNHSNVDVSSLSKGIYIVKVDGLLTGEVIVIQK